PGAEPVQLLRLAGPPRLRIARRLLVDGRIAQQRLLAKLGRGLEALDLEQLRELAIEPLGVAHLSLASRACDAACGWGPPRPARAPARRRRGRRPAARLGPCRRHAPRACRPLRVRPAGPPARATAAPGPPPRREGRRPASDPRTGFRWRPARRQG